MPPKRYKWKGLWGTDSEKAGTAGWERQPLQVVIVQISFEGRPSHDHRKACSAGRSILVHASRPLSKMRLRQLALVELAQARQDLSSQSLEIANQLFRDEICGKAVASKPKGVERAGQSHAFMAQIGIFSGLGLSLGGIEAVSPFGHRVHFVSSCREVQRLGTAVRKRLPTGSARPVGVDHTGVPDWVRARPLKVVVDTGGAVLRVSLADRGLNWQGWFESLARELVVEVVVDDDSRDYSIAVDDARVSRQ